MKFRMKFIWYLAGGILLANLVEAFEARENNRESNNQGNHTSSLNNEELKKNEEERNETTEMDPVKQLETRHVPPFEMATYLFVPGCLVLLLIIGAIENLVMDQNLKCKYRTVEV